MVTIGDLFPLIVPGVLVIVALVVMFSNTPTSKHQK